jgi:hypothetical protein
VANAVIKPTGENAMGASEKKIQTKDEVLAE